VSGGISINSSAALGFLKRYLRLTHCDLFFADAAILVEGAAEKLLMPSMIEMSANRLRSIYLTVLEVGGAYAHRFEGLLAFLRIPYIVITDLDSVVPSGYPSACRADVSGARTSNTSLKKFCGKEKVSDLLAMTATEKADKAKDRFVAFEMDVLVEEKDVKFAMRPRTLEEAIAYENFALLRTGTLSIGIPIPGTLPEAYQNIYDWIRSDDFKKTDFAMSLLANNETWTVPAYIAEGLRWLETRLCQPVPNVSPTQAAKTTGEVSA
jgi:putative ATP-dependent endonuclease of OLD family